MTRSHFFTRFLLAFALAFLAGPAALLPVASPAQAAEGVRYAFNWRGDYSASTQYVTGDLVKSAGSVWRARVASYGQTPTSGSAYWELFVSKGNDSTSAPLISSISDLQAVTGQVNGDMRTVADQGLYRFSSSATTTANSTRIVAPSVGSGRWLTVGIGPGLDDVIDARDYGVVADGSTDDTTALAAALAATPAGGTLLLPKGTAITSAALTPAVDNVTLAGWGIGSSVLKAKAAANFQNLISGTSRTGVVVRDLTLDANQANRVAQLTTAAYGVNLSAATDCQIRNILVKNCVGLNATTPGVGIAIGGSSLRCLVAGCILEDNGIAGKTADGVFLSGTNMLAADCVAKNCLDTGFVVESSNHSGITGCISQACGASFAVTNASNSPAYGNFLTNSSGDAWTATTTGGIQVGHPSAATTGDLVDTMISGVILRNASPTSTGPALNVRQTGTAATSGLTVTGCTFDGAGEQGVLLDGCSRLSFTGNYIKSNGTCFQYGSDCDYLNIVGNTMFGNASSGTTFGIATTLTNSIAQRIAIIGNTIVGNGTTSYGIYHFGTGHASTSVSIQDNHFVGTFAVTDNAADSTAWPSIITKITSSPTYNPGSIADGDNLASSPATITGAQLGDQVLCSYSGDLAGLCAQGYVSSANNVVINLLNNTGGAVDLASGTWRLTVLRGVQ